MNRQAQIEKLKELRSKLNIKVKGLENYPQGPSLIVANHNCLLDIFSLPAALPEPTVSIVSSRVMYKNDKERKKLLNNYILPFPLERHAGRIYVEMCLNGVVELLKKGISANIFPEGGYYPKKKEVYRGKTGFTRVLFEARKSGVKVNLVPVSIKVYNDNLDIDSYQFNFDLVEVEILKPIDYEKYFELYCQSKDLTSKKEIMQRLIDNTLKPVANNLKYTYISHYMDLIKKDFIYFPDGKEISVKEANNIYYINKFKKEINRQVKILTKKLCI